MRVTILDRAWIISEVFDRKLFELATDTLRMDVNTSRREKPGPRDTKRRAELEELDGHMRTLPDTKELHMP